VRRSEPLTVHQRETQRLLWQMFFGRALRAGTGRVEVGEMLHKAERRTATTKVVRETEAEAIAFVIAKAVGLETGTASADYIHLYHGNACKEACC
jgi:hypothetical protein